MLIRYNALLSPILWDFPVKIVVVLKVCRTILFKHEIDVWMIAK